MWFASALVFQTNVLCKPSSSSSTEVEGRILFWSPAEAASGGSFLFTWTKDTISISKTLGTAEINFLSKLLLLYFAMVTYTRNQGTLLQLLIPLFASKQNFTVNEILPPQFASKRSGYQHSACHHHTLWRWQRKLLTNPFVWDVAE